MAGSSNFPESVDNKTALVDGVDYMEADNVNNAYVPINKTQTFIGANGKGASWSTDLLEFQANQKAPVCTKASGSTISVSTGVVFIKNSGQSNRLMRRNTSTVTPTASDLDTGAFADDTYYYIYAVADTAATTFTCKISASASAPTGLTNFELIGWFFNQSASALDVTLNYVGNVKANGRDVPNALVVSGTDDISTASGTYVDMTNMAIRFYSSGRPVLVIFHAPIADSASGSAWTQIDIDGTDKTATKANETGDSGFQPFAMVWMETLAAGGHTIKIEWKGDGTTLQNGATDGSRVLTVMEL